MDGLDWSIKNIDLIRRIRKIRNISNHIRGPPAVCLLMPPHSCAWTALRGSGAVCDIRTTQVVLGWSRLVSLRLWRNVCVCVWLLSLRFMLNFYSFGAHFWCDEHIHYCQALSIVRRCPTTDIKKLSVGTKFCRFRCAGYRTHQFSQWPLHRAVWPLCDPQSISKSFKVPKFHIFQNPKVSKLQNPKCSTFQDSKVSTFQNLKFSNDKFPCLQYARIVGKVSKSQFPSCARLRSFDCFLKLFSDVC